MRGGAATLCFYWCFWLISGQNTPISNKNQITLHWNLLILTNSEIVLCICILNMRMILCLSAKPNIVDQPFSKPFPDSSGVKIIPSIHFTLQNKQI